MSARLGSVPLSNAGADTASRATIIRMANLPRATARARSTEPWRNPADARLAGSPTPLRRYGAMRCAIAPAIGPSAAQLARRRDHAGLRPAVHRIGFAIAAVAPPRGHALLVGPEAAIARAAAAAAVLGTPRIGDVGAARLVARHQRQPGECAQRQNCKDASHGRTSLDD